MKLKSEREKIGEVKDELPELTVMNVDGVTECAGLRFFLKKCDCTCEEAICMLCCLSLWTAAEYTQG